MKQILIIVTLFVMTSAHAAPIPTTGDKFRPQLGVYKSPKGFEIQTASSNWIQTAPPQKSRYIATMYRSPNVHNNMRATLTVRVDELNGAMSINDYVQRWTKEYPKFGFDVKGSKKFTMNGTDGYVVDLVNPAKKRQLRQVIYMKNRTAVLLTCRDHIDTFKDSLQECNKMIKSFKWDQASNSTMTPTLKK